MKSPLSPDILRKRVPPESFGFETTAEISSLWKPLGQDRVLSALNFGLDVESHGYNVFLFGPPGAGKQTTATGVIEEFAQKGAVPDDWVYVFNFEEEERPWAIALKPGMGEEFRDDVAALVQWLIDEIPKVFQNEQYMRDREEIFRKNQEAKNEAFQSLEEMALKHNFILQRSPDGLALIYGKGGEPLSPEEFEKLTDEDKAVIQKSRDILQEKLRETIALVREIDKKTQESLKELENRYALAAVGQEFALLEEKYGPFPKVVRYLQALKKDSMENIAKFRVDAREGPPIPLPFFPQPEGPGELIKRYRVNLLVNNKGLRHAPVIFESNPNHHNLLGRLEYRAQYGTFFTDYTQIKAGAFHRANGGFLVLNAREVLLNPFAYEAMKRVLKDQEIRMEEVGEQYRLISTTTLRPEPIPTKLKVVLLGTQWIYYLLQMYDEDFHKLFKVKGEFAHEMEDNEDNRMCYAYLVAKQREREGLLHFGRGAVSKIVEEGLRMAGNQKKLSTHFLSLCDLVREASHWAKKDGREVVDEAHVKKALDQMKYRSDYLEKRLGEMIEDGSILIDTEGAVSGQVNGLSVYDMGDYAFGKPSRVTARVFLGKEGVVNIERESELGGPIHNKGMLILQGFFGARYAQRVPLTFGASICFEQSYGGVEGDSASSTELYALISAITDIPLRQDIAVTGSVNQMGHVQAIGGVNLKIEGFYNTCKAKGLTGTQGVMIPQSNVQNLMLDEEVIKAVSEGKFHIYSVATIDEGLEILTGMDPGEPNEFDDYPEGTINARVVSRLERFANQWKKLHTD